MKVACEKCNGSGYMECLHCVIDGDCPICDGSGNVSECVSTVKIPKNLKNYDAVLLLQQDALRCVRDHERISILKPSHKLSYDEQLAETLKNLEAEAKALCEA